MDSPILSNIQGKDLDKAGPGQGPGCAGTAGRMEESEYGDHSQNSLILQEGRSSLSVGPFPMSPFNTYTCVLNLTGSRQKGHKNALKHAEHMAAVAADPIRLRFLNKSIGDSATLVETMLFLLQGSSENDAIPFLLRAWNDGNKILVHCQEGTSRAPTVAAALIIALHRQGGCMLLADRLARGLSLAQAALEVVRERRPGIQPNAGFLVALERFATAPTAASQEEREEEVEVLEC